jgi:hypothetical protein
MSPGLENQLTRNASMLSKHLPPSVKKIHSYSENANFEQISGPLKGPRPIHVAHWDLATDQPTAATYDPSSRSAPARVLQQIAGL